MFNLSCTDAETSDEEYVQTNHAAAEDSDVCSDLDEDEGTKLTSSNQKTDSVEQESTNQDSDEDQDYNSDSDEDDIGGPLISQRTHHHKTKPTGLRILDSDEEEEVQNETEKTQPPNTNIVDSMLNLVSESTSNSLTQNTDHNIPERSAASAFSADHSISMFSSASASRTSGPKNTSLSNATEKSPRFSVFRRSSVLVSPEEASMPPLVLNASFDSEDSNNSLNDRGAPISSNTHVLQTTKNFVSSTSTCSISGSEKEYIARPIEVSSNTLQPTGAVSTFDLPKDSGIGRSIAGNASDKPNHFYEANDDDSQLTLELDGEQSIW